MNTNGFDRPSTGAEGQRALYLVAANQSEDGGSAAPITTKPRATELANFIGGFVAAEGSFTRSGTKFVFAVGLGAVDTCSCNTLKEFFAVGTIHHYARRKEHYDDEVTFQVRKFRDLVEVVVPFMDEHLPPSYKRIQYEAWRAGLLDYWERRAKRVRPCTVEGCEEPRRRFG